MGQPARRAKGMLATPSPSPEGAVAAEQGVRPTISLCMIVRNEAEHLPRCLTSVAGLVDDVVVVDTGSTDETIAIARRFGARVFHFTWTDDFAAARNSSLEPATADWILWLDADETLDAKTAPNLRRLVALPHSGPRGIAVPIRNHLGGQEGVVVQHYAVRLFERHPRVRFHRPIHEDVIHLDGPERLDRVVSDDLIIDHFGYRAGVVEARQKEVRNLSALEKAIGAGSADPYDYYLLARERYAFGNLAGAVDALRPMFRLAPTEEPLYAGEGYAILVAALTGLGRLDEAVAAAERGLRLHPYTDLWHNAAVAHLERGDVDSAIAAYRQALAHRNDGRPYTRDLSISTWRAWHGLGEAFRRKGDLAAARSALKAAIAAAPLERDIVLTAAAVSCLAGRPDEGIPMVERYLAAHPEDELLQQLLADARRSLARQREVAECQR